MDALASFAFVVLILWLLRFAKQNSLLEMMKALKEKTFEFEIKYEWRVTQKYIRKEARILIPFFKYRFLFFVVLLATIYNR